MSLGIILKAPEGIILAADSRVTLTKKIQRKNQDEKLLLASTFDNATKLLKVSGQKYVGVVTYGLGAIGLQAPRTAHSFISEFEERVGLDNRLSIEEFSKSLSDFFMEQWNKMMPKEYSGDDLIFLIGGYNEGDSYGKVFEIDIPSNPNPSEHNPDTFGIVWGGQRGIVDRIINGFDDRLLEILQNYLKIPDNQIQPLRGHLKSQLSIGIPYQFLPLQDCVDLAIFFIRTTIEMQTKLVEVRGVGGAIDIAVITKIGGFQSIQEKIIAGEKKYGGVI